MASVIIVYAWKNVGMNMVYWIAALQAVPEELHEAAGSMALTAARRSSMLRFRSSCPQVRSLQ